jgi:hypothetical protein
MKGKLAAFPAPFGGDRAAADLSAFPRHPRRLRWEPRSSRSHAEIAPNGIEVTASRRSTSPTAYSMIGSARAIDRRRPRPGSRAPREAAALALLELDGTSGARFVVSAQRVGPMGQHRARSSFCAEAEQWGDRDRL